VRGGGCVGVGLLVCGRGKGGGKRVEVRGCSRLEGMCLAGRKGCRDAKAELVVMVTLRRRQRAMICMMSMTTRMTRATARVRMWKRAQTVIRSMRVCEGLRLPSDLKILRGPTALEDLRANTTYSMRKRVLATPKAGKGTRARDMLLRMLRLQENAGKRRKLRSVTSGGKGVVNGL
jgi:hypothetical protein